MSGCPFNHSEVPPHHPVTPKEAEAEDEKTESILGFQTANAEFIHGGEKTQPTHYGTYLGIGTLLNLQSGPAAGKAGGEGIAHHEELTFIIVHQVFELWFKLVTADLRKSHGFLLSIAEEKDMDVATASNLMTQCLHYLRRSEAVFQHVQGAFGIMETMHPADFIEFRDFLVPASGFQSVSFRSLEQLLGVPNTSRALVNNATVFSYLTQAEQDKLTEEAKLPSVNEIVMRILCRLKVPDDFVETYLKTTRKILEEQQYVIAKTPKGDEKAEHLIETGVDRMKAMLDDPLSWSEGLVLNDSDSPDDYKKAVIAALFVISYRFENRFSTLAALLDALIAVEEGMLLWRGRHLHMAERMIGRRGGTGGTSSGVGYLDITRRYRIFHLLWLVRKMFIRASALPPFASYKLPEGTLF